MTKIELIDWTLEEAQQLRSEEDRHNEPSPSLGRLLCIPEEDFLEPDRSEPTAQVISFPTQPSTAYHATVGEPVVTEKTGVPDLFIASMVEKPPFEKSLAAEEQKSALLMAIMEPTIQTDQAYRDRAIALRWALRDIKANRLNWSPISGHGLQALIDLGLVEVVRNEPILTNAGLSAVIR
jgi:hypothetical protein